MQTSFASERTRLLQSIAEYLVRSSQRGPLASLQRAAMELIQQLLAEPPGEARSTDELVRVQRAFGLRPFEIDALLLAVLAETEWRFGRVLAYVQDNPALCRPTIGLALLLAPGETEPSVFDLCDGALVRDGLVILDGDGALPTRVLRPTRDVTARLVGARRSGTNVAEPDPTLLGTLVLDDDANAIIARWCNSPRHALVLTGTPGSGRKTVARAAMGRVGVRLVRCDTRGDSSFALIARRDSIWYDAAPLLVAEEDDTVDWRSVVRTLVGLPHPMALVVAPRHVDGVSAAVDAHPSIVRVGNYDSDVRRRLWRGLVPATTDDATIDAMVSRFAFGPGRIARVVEIARREADPPTREALISAAREVGRAAMGTLAQRMPLPFTRDDLVVTERVNAELELALGWVRHQRQVQLEWGLGRRIARGRGLTVLFAGGPGTGKTMAAQVLARELGLELYLIDLSRVLNKYIGETEKHLARLFDEARDSGTMLFFDEGDALFGKRTEASDAQDRYANVEVAYLLQRMEQHEGVTVLATNRLRDIDEAFVRRFHVIADFTLPEAADRLQIWNRMLAPPVVCEGELRLGVVARELSLSGGQIRNVVLTAAHFAAADSRPIDWSHIERALRRELKQQGRVFDDRISRALGEAPRH